MSGKADERSAGPRKTKRVTVAVNMDLEFVRLLKANVELRGLREKDELTATDQLALTVLAEARGAYPEQVHATILPTWRPHFEAVGELRKVTE